MKQTPRWEHNCPNCKFMDRHEKYDMYYCPGPHNSPWRPDNTSPRLVSNNRGGMQSTTLNQHDIYRRDYITPMLILALKAKYITKEQADNILNWATQ